MSETKSVVEVKGIHKSFGKLEVLKGVDLTVNESEAVVIMGPSGSGKTTLLRCINFLEKADSGLLRIRSQEADLANVSKKQIIEMRRMTAMVFQNYDLFLNRTVLENVTEGLVTARKVPRAEADEIAVGFLKKVGMEGRLGSRPYQLSGGQQQRVGIARALALNPEVILFDEPTSALDPERVEEILALIKEVAKSGVTMIIVTHEMEFAYDAADKVVFIDGGEVLEQGPPRSLFKDPKHERTKQFISRFQAGKRPEYFI
jgi:L-cystine transport system ATP-binding protein